MDASLVGADLTKWALRIGGTFGRRLSSFAKRSRVTSEFGKARADAIVICGFADCIHATSSINVARVLANFVDASLFEFAVDVVAAAFEAAVVLANLAERAGRVYFTVVVGNRFALDVRVA